MQDPSKAQSGDLVQLVGLRHKHFILTLISGSEFQTHRGVLRHDDLIGRIWGSPVYSHTGAPFFLLKPSLADLLIELPRSSQILYPKDIGFILVTMGIGPGQFVMEAGTGSGSMTMALAHTVGANGKVVTYDQREDMQNLARKNLQRVGYDDRVEYKLRDIRVGFDESNAEAFFLDVPNPYDYISQVRSALKPGGFFCTLVPTFNQVEKTLHALRQNKFAFLEVCEILLRYFKAEPTRLRPTDRMVAHTGFLIFARRIEADKDGKSVELLTEAGMIEIESESQEVE